MKIRATKALTFDDVLLIPRRSAIKSRNDVSTVTRLTTQLKINIPLLSANMDTVTEAPMAIAMAKNGGIGMLHRFMTVEQQVKQVQKVKRARGFIVEKPYSILVTASVAEANETMRRHQVGGLMVMDEDGNDLRSPSGAPPFLDRVSLTPNEAYFTHVDAVVAKAGQLGLVMGLLPTWGSYWKQVGRQAPPLLGVDTARAFGRYLGRRYAAGELKAVRVIYNRFQSISEHVPTEAQVLPPDPKRLRGGVSRPGRRFPQAQHEGLQPAGHHERRGRVDEEHLEQLDRRHLVEGEGRGALEDSQRPPQAVAGDPLIAKWGIDLPEAGQQPILILCHMDTVYELGTLARFPVYAEAGVLHGPGVFDMKGGIVALIFALRRLREISGGALPLRRPLWALFTSDEETGSQTSRPLIESLARQAGAVFCLEPALPGGELKTSRKGTGKIATTARGKAAHAGMDHVRGRNAIEELAHHILSVQKLTDYERGTTTNVGIVRAGTRTNIVPDEAVAEVDFRVSQPGEVARLQAWAAGLQPVIEGCTVQAEVSANRPPMPRDAAMALAFQKAQAIGRKLGLELGEGATGGGSDANFVAPLGVPVLDGLGVRGDGSHSEREHTIIDSLPERAALLAALLMEW